MVICATLALAGGVLAVIGFRSSAQGSSDARFDVIFDDARGLIGGQLIKVAGARAGVITNVVVTPDFKARIKATIESQFMPFHQDATCTIRPEGLIAENYVDCDPGTLGSPPLKGNPPTVPVTHTTEPVSLLDLFNIFNLPTRERFTAIVDELGIGTAGRGDDFNDILRRANPALAEARQVIGILDRQRSELAGSVDATSTIAAEGAAHPVAVQAFLDRAAALTSLTATHRDQLSQTVARLPPLLAAAQPALSELDTVARDGTPLVEQLHVAVPSLNRVQRDLGPFAAAATPALADLTRTLRRADPAIRDATPLVRTLATYTAGSMPGTRLFAQLASNLQQHGFVENFLGVVYYVGAALARYDGTSHLLSLLLISPQNGQCSTFAATPVAGCSAHYGTQPAYRPTTPVSQTARQPAAAPATRSDASPAGPASPSAAPAASPSGSSAPPGASPGSGSGQTRQLQNLASYLLR